MIYILITLNTASIFMCHYMQNHGERSRYFGVLWARSSGHCAYSMTILPPIPRSFCHPVHEHSATDSTVILPPLSGSAAR